LAFSANFLAGRFCGFFSVKRKLFILGSTLPLLRRRIGTEKYLADVTTKRTKTKAALDFIQELQLKRREVEVHIGTMESEL
jgi:hypothetical protein